ncbi:acyl-CoA thioesterase [Salipiger sp. P9]|uniref:acyl-CoA thioesterase n=1 Tax=Salipiger pentaromativorans TaxID=2943193 RepID=UPI00215715B9|nr:acyl-CoA thioesterase [Salipiger pentaromativorans]MCR8548289.1 acyl-CoA thioesterase [Salipiger pentaromativorans]
MYPFIRMAKEIWLTRKLPPLEPNGVHVSHHMCWPWDLDMWNELNNGRTLTLLDLGRFPLAMRAGLMAALKRERWRMTMAGVVVRYRRRIQTFEKIEMRSRLIGWDHRFLYIEQSLWKTDGECANQAVYRAAVTDRKGIVTTDRVMAALGADPVSPELPIWVQHWLRAEDERPWPPARD